MTTCNSAESALSILHERKGDFDIVLSDVHMPDMDGFKLMELIKSELDIPVISMFRHVLPVLREDNIHF